MVSVLMGSRARAAHLRWALLCGALVTCLSEGAVGAQGRRGAPPEAEPVIGAASPAELQRLFDVYTVVQAQEMLQLTDAQYPEFLVRLRALQDVRRRAQVERARLIAELRRLADRARREAAASAEIEDRLKALRALDSRGQAEAQQALERVDEVLEPVQQARLRVLEEQMERRKLELLVRARQAARARRAR